MGGQNERTFEHVIREVIMCWDVRTGISERVEKAKGRESLREGKEPRKCRVWRPEIPLVFEKHLGARCRIHQYGEEREAQGTHAEGRNQIFANDVPVHVGFSETEVAHHTQTDPEGIVDDPQLCMKFIALAGIRTTLGKFINALVRDDSKASNGNMLQNAAVNENKSQRESVWYDGWGAHETTAFSARVVKGA
jgi:hypothetical protein